MLYKPQKFPLSLSLSLSLFRHREGGEETMGVCARGSRGVQGRLPDL
jgi:hypothetical protein